MFYLLFIIYLVFFCWLIPRIKFFKNTGLGKYFLIGLFIARVLAGLINGYIFLYYYPVSDIAFFHQQGIEEFHLLFHNTAEYFTNIFQTNHSGYGAFLESSNSYWNDTRSNLIIKMLSIFDIFSGKNFFINSLFFNFLVFFGTAALYKVFIEIFPTQKIVVVICVFLLPSVIFFSSAIHRDGLIYLSISMVIYHLFFMMKNKYYPWKKILITLFFTLLIVLLRNFVLIIMLPALLSWLIAAKRPKYSLIIFSGVYFFLGILFFCTTFLPHAYNLPAHVAGRQAAFIEIAKGGVSSISINLLHPNFKSFLINIPQAINHSFMRPYLTEHVNFLYILSALEIFFYEVLFLFFIFFRKKNMLIYPLIYFSIFFTITMFIVIGYTIPIIGAIVRYRSIYFPFVLIPVICYTDWSKIKKLII